MNFWFVVQSTTSHHKGNESYLWCPKKNKRGKAEIINSYFENMRRVKPGDVILAYFDGGVQGYGVALTYSYTYLRPPHFKDQWDKIGWRCDVDFTRFHEKVDYRKHSKELVAEAFKKGEVNPLTKHGILYQSGYLSRVTPEFVRIIAQDAKHKELLAILRGKAAAVGGGQALDTIGYRHALLDDLAMRNIKNEYDADSVRDLLKARYGLGVFREHVAQLEKYCRVTSQHHSYALTACHIKPWRDANNDERLVGANGLLLDPSAARLFNYGFFSFENNGSLIKAEAVAADDPLTHPLFKGKPAKRTFNADQKHFLQHHREYVLLKPYKR